MRLANEIAAAAMEHVREQLRPGMKEARGRPRSGRASSTAQGTGWQGQVELALGVLARLVRARDQDVHGDRRPAGRGRRADAVRDLGLRRRLLVPTTRRTSARASCAPSTPSCESSCSAVYERRDRPLPPGREPRRARPARPRRHRRDRLPGPADATRSATASARARTSRPTRTRPAAASSRRAWCSRSSRASTGTEAAASASRTTSSSPPTAPRSSRRSRTAVVRCG